MEVVPVLSTISPNQDAISTTCFLREYGVVIPHSAALAMKSPATVRFPSIPWFTYFFDFDSKDFYALVGGEVTVHIGYTFALDQANHLPDP